MGLRADRRTGAGGGTNGGRADGAADGWTSWQIGGWADGRTGVDRRTTDFRR